MSCVAALKWLDGRGTGVGRSWACVGQGCEIVMARLFEDGTGLCGF